MSLEEILLKGKGGKEAWKLSTRFSEALNYIDDYLESATVDNVNNLILQLEKRKNSKKYWANSATIGSEALNTVLGRLKGYVSDKAYKLEKQEAKEKANEPQKTAYDWLSVEEERFNDRKKTLDGWLHMGRVPTNIENIVNLAKIVQDVMERRPIGYGAERAKVENLAIKLDSEVYHYAKELGIDYRPITLVYQIQAAPVVNVEERFEVKKGFFSRFKEGLSYIFRNKKPPQWDYSYAPSY